MKLSLKIILPLVISIAFMSIIVFYYDKPKDKYIMFSPPDEGFCSGSENRTLCDGGFGVNDGVCKSGECTLGKTLNLCTSDIDCYNNGKNYCGSLANTDSQVIIRQYCVISPSDEEDGKCVYIQNKSCSSGEVCKINGLGEAVCG